MPEIVQRGSARFEVNWLDVKKIAIGAAVALGGAALTYLVDTVLPDLKEKEAISASLFVVFTTLLNALRKFLTDKRNETTTTVIVDPPA